MKPTAKTLGQIAFEVVFKYHGYCWENQNAHSRKAWQSAAEKVVKISNQRKRKRLNARNLAFLRAIFEDQKPIGNFLNKPKKGQSK